MADSTIEKVLLFGGLGIAGWWIYSTFFSGASTAASSSVSTPGGTGTGAGSGSGSAAPPSSPAAPSLPTYSGPTLAQLYQSLLSAVQAGYNGGDKSVTCPGSDPSSAMAGCQSQYQITAANPLTAPAAAQTLAACLELANKPPSSCLIPSASYDVFNWYLTNRAGLPSSLVAPANPNHTAVISITDYWSWASPLLQAQVKGLSGLRGRGMGHIANIRSIVLGGAA